MQVFTSKKENPHEHNLKKKWCELKINQNDVGNEDKNLAHHEIRFKNIRKLVENNSFQQY